MQTLVSQQDVSISKLALSDEETAFHVTVVEAQNPSRVVLFAVGGGGNPERHLPLLASLAGQDGTVVAPHFERLVSPIPTRDDLVLRARRLKLALDWAWRPGLPTAGVGHSIGAAILLALAGGKMWTQAREKLAIDPDARLDKLVLLTPVMAFFQAPGALDAVHAPIQAWAGGQDGITLAPQIDSALQPLVNRGLAELRRVEGAGHFSFMNQPPPHSTEPLPDRDAFLAQMAQAVGGFIRT
jgi:pimeloyl-ACP methyl ester carboxylesterase